MIAKVTAKKSTTRRAWVGGGWVIIVQFALGKFGLRKGLAVSGACACSAGARLEKASVPAAERRKWRRCMGVDG
jgi:hypothetical protein